MYRIPLLALLAAALLAVPATAADLPVTPVLPDEDRTCVGAYTEHWVGAAACAEDGGASVGYGAGAYYCEVAVGGDPRHGYQAGTNGNC